MKIDYPTLAPNRQAGFARAWEVFSDYTLRDGLIIPNMQKTVRMYGPMAHPEMPTALATLRDGSEKDVLEFVRTYGLLGFRELSIDSSDAPIGEPLDWIVSHARTVHLAMRLIHILQGDPDDETEDLNELRDVLRLDPEAALPNAHTMYASGSGMRPSLWPLSSAKSWKNGLSTCRHILKDIINPNITGIVPTLYEGKDNLCLFYSYEALIQTIYYQLAVSATGGRIQRCAAAGCGGLFIQRDPRQRFCPPWFEGPGESRCSLRERARRARRTHKTKKGARR